MIVGTFESVRLLLLINKRGRNVRTQVHAFNKEIRKESPPPQEPARKFKQTNRALHISRTIPCNID